MESVRARAELLVSSPRARSARSFLLELADARLGLKA